MPIYDYQCNDCGCVSEVLVFGKEEGPTCVQCGSSNMTKQVSAHSSLSGPSKHSLPGAGDTTCCGSSPGAAGCAGPGSCCGKAF